MLDEKQKQSIEDSKTFFDTIEKHLQLIDESKDYANVCKSQSFNKGQKIYLELTIEDSTLNQYLFTWLALNKLLFGAKLEAIHFDSNLIKKQELKDKLFTFLNKEFNIE